MKKQKRKTEHYLDNKKFFEEMQKWKKTVLEAEQSGEDKPPVTEYIGIAFLQIAENLAKKPNFVNYQFKEDMISDGVENCLMYASNFDPEKSSNPFSYFTQIIYYAFLRRIQKEKKQNYIKYKYLESLDKVGDFSEILRMMGITDEEKNSFSTFEKKSKGKKKE
jgi:DNA-directed RNA polymerase specialized sigma subunit